MKFVVTFKTPDAISEALDSIEGQFSEDCDELTEQMDKAQKVVNKFVQYGEYITIEFDTENQTAKVVYNG